MNNFRLWKCTIQTVNGYLAWHACIHTCMYYRPIYWLWGHWQRPWKTVIVIYIQACSGLWISVGLFFQISCYLVQPPVHSPQQEPAQTRFPLDSRSSSSKLPKESTSEQTQARSLQCEPSFLCLGRPQLLLQAPLLLPQQPTHPHHQVSHIALSSLIIHD